MIDTIKELPIWFRNRLKKIMEHNEYPEDCLTVTNCLTIDNWSPCDLIAREELNNGGGSAGGFLGITPTECHKCYYFMKENKQLFIDKDLISKTAWNNSGFQLWDNYDF